MRKGRTGKGFTLIEMVIAAAIMAMGLAVFATALSMASKAVYSAKREAQAIAFARQEMENIRIKTYKDPALNLGNTSITNINYGGIKSVTQISTNIKGVAISIYWTNNAVGSVYTARITTAFCSALH